MDRSYLDWPFLAPHHKQLALDIDHWARQSLPPLLAGGHDDVDATCQALVRALGEAGWLRYCVPAAYGGATDALEVRALAIIRETLAFHSGLADFAFAMQGLGSGAISLFGSEALKQKYLPAVATGEKIAAFALSEPDAGSDAAAIKSALTPTATGYSLSGEKTWISNGGIADFYCVFARTGEGARGVSAIVLDAKTEGFSIPERIDVIAPHPLARIAFDECRIDSGQRIGAEGEGFKIALTTLDIFRTTVGAAALGFARRALDEATGHALSRRMFGATLSDLPIAQSQLAEMALDVDAAALLIYRSAWVKDVQRTRVTREAAMAKLFATDHGQVIIDKAVQLLGGLGVKTGSKVEELYREIRALRIYEGASEVQKIVIARQHIENFRSEAKP
jgi:acyl-CoA dehydrogenase